MADEQPTPERIFFQPLPEHDTLNAAYFLLRVADSVLVEQGCWVWKGARNRRGYGRLDYGGRKHMLHRLVYHLCVAPVLSTNIEVCHRCDNTSCLNPAHLFLGTHSDNMEDAARKGRIRTPRLRGEGHPQAKYTDAAIRDIRKRGASGERGIVRLLAEEYHTSQGTIHDICSRRRWGHVADEVDAS